MPTLSTTYAEANHVIRIQGQMIDAMQAAAADNAEFWIIGINGGHVTGALAGARIDSPFPAQLPPQIGGEISIRQASGSVETVDFLDIANIFPLRTPAQAAK